jgi:hypothetical protein
MAVRRKALEVLFSAATYTDEIRRQGRNFQRVEDNAFHLEA